MEDSPPRIPSTARNMAARLSERESEFGSDRVGPARAFGLIGAHRIACPLLDAPPQALEHVEREGSERRIRPAEPGRRRRELGLIGRAPRSVDIAVGEGLSE